MPSDSVLVDRLSELYQLNPYDPWQRWYLSGPVLDPYTQFPEVILPRDFYRDIPASIPLLPNQLFRAEGEFTGEVIWEDHCEGMVVPAGASLAWGGLLVEVIRTRDLRADRVERQVFGVFELCEHSEALSLVFRRGRQLIRTFVVHSVVPAGAPRREAATRWPDELIGMVTYNGDVIMGGWDETEQKLIPWALNIEVVVPPKPRRSPGRPKGSHDHPSLPEMLRAVEALYAKQERPTREKLMQQLGRAGDPRRVNEWLTPHKLNFPALCRMAKPL